jgi:hypothetical protein
VLVFVETRTTSEVAYDSGSYTLNRSANLLCVRILIRLDRRRRQFAGGDRIFAAIRSTPIASHPCTLHVASRTAHGNLEICRGIIIRLRKKLVVTTVVARDCVSQRFPSVLCFCAREREKVLREFSSSLRERQRQRDRVLRAGVDQERWLGVRRSIVRSVWS